MKYESDEAKALAMAMAKEPGEPEREHTPIAIPVERLAGATKFNLFGWWFGIVHEPTPSGQMWCVIYEYDGTWKEIRRFAADAGYLHKSFKEAQKWCRKFLLEGQRPQAEAKNPELAMLVSYFKDNGQHFFRKDGEHE